MGQGVDRRTLLAAAAAVAIDPAVPPEVIDLWPAAPPGPGGPAEPERADARGAITRIARPRLVAYRPAEPTGVAAIVMAGGGYARVEAGRESTPLCRWLRDRGVAAFELIYRLPEDGWPPAAPFEDASRAVRVVRARAAGWGIDPARVGVVGFSAGGHLAGMTAARPDASPYAPVDGADAVSARPDFAALVYPVLSMTPPLDRTRARREILGRHPTAAEGEAHSVDRLVDARTPPTFLAHAADDPIAPVGATLATFAALRAAGVPAELHVFQAGGHGWGMGRDGAGPAAWPALLAAWAGIAAR